MDASLGILQDRVDSLVGQFKSSRYQQKKSKAQKTFEEFLLNLGKKISDCEPNDICLFLAWKDRVGKTRIHTSSCSEVGERVQKCQCPKRLAWGTLSGLVSSLQGMFNMVGRRGAWSEIGKSGNPVMSEKVSAFVQQVKVEQSKAHVAPRQAVPMFLSKLTLIAMYIDRHLDLDIKNTAKFVLARDQALFKLQFFATDRGADIGQMWCQEVKVLPNSEGLMIRHTWGKTFRLDRPKVFSVFKAKNQMICPVAGLQRYMEVAKALKVDLRTGFLFRPISSQGVVLEQPLSGEAIYDRLKCYLGKLGIDQGETPHSLRGGSAISLLSCQKSQNLDGVMKHVGWASNQSAQLYTRSAQSDQAAALSKSMANLGAFQQVKEKEGNFVDFLTLQKLSGQ